MKAKKTEAENVPSVSGTFQTICSVRGSDNLLTFSLVTITVKDGQVIEVHQTQPDLSFITTHRADMQQRANYQPIEDVIK